MPSSIIFSQPIHSQNATQDVLRAVPCTMQGTNCFQTYCNMKLLLLTQCSTATVYRLRPTESFPASTVTAEQCMLSNSKSCQINECVYWENGRFKTTVYLCKSYFKVGKMLWKFLKYSKQFCRKHNAKGALKSKRCKPLNTPNATDICQWGKQIKMSIRWRNFSLKQLKHSPWFCWQAEKFIFLFKEFEKQYVGVLKHMYSCWLRMRRNVWTCARIFSSDEMSFNTLCPL